MENNNVTGIESFDFYKNATNYLSIAPFENFDCLHMRCIECNGSGNKKNGEICVHFISCNCNNCNATY